MIDETAIAEAPGGLAGPPSVLIIAIAVYRCCTGITPLKGQCRAGTAPFDIRPFLAESRDRPGLEDVEDSGVPRPFDVLRRSVVPLDLETNLRQLNNALIVQCG